MHRIFPLGTGCAPFRSFIEERVSQSAGGKLKFMCGQRQRETGTYPSFRIELNVPLQHRSLAGIKSRRLEREN